MSATFFLLLHVLHQEWHHADLLDERVQTKNNNFCLRKPKERSISSFKVQLTRKSPWLFTEME
jgi:hypothetical protein